MKQIMSWVKKLWSDDLTVGLLRSCPVCEEKGMFVKYQTRFDVNKRVVSLEICRHCTVIANATDLASLSQINGDNYERQKQGSEHFYAVSEDEMNREAVAKQVHARRGMMDFALSEVPVGFKRGAFADLGAGAGYLAGAAAHYFDRVYAIDFNTSIVKSLHQLFEEPDKITISDNLHGVSGMDMITMWHALEHMPRPLECLRSVQEKLNHGGVVFFQCPMLRPDYVVSTHYVFFSEYSLRVMCERAGFRNVKIWFDMDYDFISCMATKAPAPSYSQRERE